MFGTIWLDVKIDVIIWLGDNFLFTFWVIVWRDDNLDTIIWLDNITVCHEHLVLSLAE
jgi:hypothetical protein